MKIYLDMDGTLVDFVSQVNKCGFWRKDKENKVDWKKVKAMGSSYGGFQKIDNLKEFLATHHGLLIRDASNFEGLDAGYFRIAVQTAEEDDQMIKAITEWIES